MHSLVPSVIPCESGVCGEAVSVTGQAAAPRACAMSAPPHRGSPCSYPSTPCSCTGPPSAALYLISSRGWGCLSVLFGAVSTSWAQTRRLSELSRSRLDERETSPFLHGARGPASAPLTVLHSLPPRPPQTGSCFSPSPVKGVEGRSLSAPQVTFSEPPAQAAMDLHWTSI